MTGYPFDPLKGVEFTRAADGIVQATASDGRMWFRDEGPWRDRREDAERDMAERLAKWYADNPTCACGCPLEHCR